MSRLILRELKKEDEFVFLKGFDDWKNEDIHWYSFVWKPGMSFLDHLNELENQKDQNKIEKNKVPSAMLYAFVDNEIVGRLNIRYELNQWLCERGGHIGYAVSPRHRKLGYATEIFRQGLLFCQKLGLEKTLVTCGDQNIASWKIIEKFAADLENRIFDSEKNEFVRRYWVDVSKSLSGQFNIYQKVVAYITRHKNNESELLVFDHDKEFSEAGTQVPAGSVVLSENFEEAVLREVFEEAGLDQKFEVKKIDEYLFFADWSNKYIKRHIFHLKTESLISDRWIHKVSGHGEDQFMNFHFYWVKLSEINGLLSGRFEDSVFKLVIQPHSGTTRL